MKIKMLQSDRLTVAGQAIAKGKHVTVSDAMAARLIAADWAAQVVDVDVSRIAGALQPSETKRSSKASRKKAGRKKTST